MRDHEMQKLKAYQINFLNKLKRNVMEKLEVLEQKMRDDDLLTINQAAEQYSVSAKTIYRWRDSGLECLQNGTGGKILIKRLDLENFIKRKKYGRQV